MNDVFLHRTCPACDGQSKVEEVHSVHRAETKTLDELEPYWSGLFKEKLFFSYYRCDVCKILYAPEFFTNDQLAALYSAMAPNMDVVPLDAIEATQRGYWSAVKGGDFLNGGYLEIGADVGHVVKYAVADGEFDHFWLVEPNRLVHDQLSASAGGKPHDIIADMDDLSQVPDGSVGLAVMVHVLDHLLDPMASLESIRRKLKPGGRLLIVTHNEASVLRSVMGRRWPPFCLQHPQLYNPDSIAELLRRAGYGSAHVARSTNYFPIGFMIRQAAYTVGLDLGKLPLPKAPLGLKLGNMITIANC
jgi:SAM-dependent methyltransferase